MEQAAKQDQRKSAIPSARVVGRVIRPRVQRFIFAGLITVLYLYCFPYFQGIRSANELPRVYLTMAMVDEGSFAIDSGVERWGKTADVSPHDGHLYSNKAPGSSMLAVPAYAFLKFTRKLTGEEPTLAEVTWVCRFFTGVLPTLLFMLLLWRFMHRFAPSLETRRLLLAGYALGSMAMTYSVLFISHQLAAVCIASAYILTVWVTEEGMSVKWMWAVGLAAGCAPLVDYQAAFAGVPIAVFLIVKLVQQKHWKGVGYAIGGAIAPIALLLFYHSRAFGGALKTGYGASKSFAHFHQQGFLGMDKLRMEAFSGSMISPENGLLLLCPMMLLAIPGWFLMAKRKNYWHMGVTLSIAIIYVGFVSSLIFWRGGWQLGPRYIVAMLPFMLVPIGVSLTWAETRWPARGIAVGMIGVGIVIYSVSTAFFPHFPEKFDNPFYELVLRLLWDGHAAYNVGYLVGLRGFVSLVPYFAALGTLLVWIAYPAREHRKSALLGAGVCIAVLASYSLFHGGGIPADKAYQWIVTVMP